MMHRQISRWILPGLPLLAMLCACSPLGPDYHPPEVAMPSAWKGQGADAGILWQMSTPSDAASKADWWTIFGDAQLNALEARCLGQSPTLQLALARLDQARAQETIRGAAMLPMVQLNPSESRGRISANRPLSNYGLQNASTVQNDSRFAVNVSYEFDWLGKVRRDVEAAHATAEQARADSENVRLLLTAEVASNYFRIRQLDEEIANLTDTTKAQGQIVRLMQRRYAAGAAGQADLAQQTALAEATLAQLELLIAQRRQAENTLGTLLGIPAADFRLEAGRLPAQPPAIPATVPSTLLERRPDVASAERGVAAANAQIGVAQAAYYPSLTLAPSYLGYESARMARLLDSPSLIWSIGLSAAQILFDGGRTRGGVDYAQAGYTAAVAGYRQTVLVAIREVQDALDGLHEAEVAGQHQNEAVQQQGKAYRISLSRYREGLDNGLTLALNEQAKLAAERSQSQIRGSQFALSVALIKALGGSWALPPAPTNEAHKNL